MLSSIKQPTRCIITPTFIGHFDYIKSYLRTFSHYLCDKNFPIYFIITKEEAGAFNKIINKYRSKLNLNVVFLEDIFIKYDIKETPQEILKKYGRLSFQTIKKLYGALYIGAEQFLLLDSESELIRVTNMNELFDGYFKKPSLVATSVSSRTQEYMQGFTHNYIKSIASVLGNSPEYWLVESYNWFYELKIVKDLIKDHGNIIDIVKSCKLGSFNDLEGILECLLYYQYNNKYNYHIVIFDKEVEKNCPEYIQYFNQSVYYKSGMFEMFSHFLNDKNVSFFKQFVIQNNLNYVLRFEKSRLSKQHSSQISFINTVKPNIIASSQEHTFGINCILLSEKSLIKHMKMFLKPFKSIFHWIKEPFLIIFYCFRIGLSFIKRE